ncbi:MAG: class I SAM-dependent methyltransferase [Vicinamibacterales bacterium]
MNDWLRDHAALLPATGRALDVACGRGNNALWLAERGFLTHAVDRDGEAVRALNDEARARDLPLVAEVLDLERGDRVLAPAVYDVIVVVHYLHRPLFPQIVAALRPDGVLVYETFTIAQAARGKPTNPAFLLKPGELRELVKPLVIVAEREGDFDGRMIASVVARRVDVRSVDVRSVRL